MLSDSLQGRLQAGVSGIYMVTTVYNEESSIEGVIKAVALWHANSKYGRALLKWVVVDDGSTDNSFEIIKSQIRRNPFIKFLVLSRNYGKGWAFRRAAEWIANQDSQVGSRVIFQLDSDLRGLKPFDLDLVISKLVRPVHLGSYTGPRLTSLALVPSRQKWEAWKAFRKFIGRLTAKERIAITGQRAYLGSIMLAVIPQITQDTGFGLEPLLDAVTIEESKRLQHTYGFTERERRALIAVTHWHNVSHITHMEKVWHSSTNPFRRLAFLNVFLTFVYVCGHYISIFWDCACGVVHGIFKVKSKWMSKRRFRRGRA